jgi:hypothetical protein
MCAAALLGACGSDDSSSGTSKDAGAGIDGTLVVADAAPSDAATVTADSGGGTVTGCLSGSAPDAGPTAACTLFEQCAQGSCNSQFAAAFGAGWAGGTVSGACAGFYQCASAGGCSSSAISGCEGSISAGCAIALGAVESCLQGTCSSEQTSCNASLGGLIPTDGGDIVTDSGSDAGDAD